ncbi:MAG TPA: GNAT family N-acetyltransferase [Acidimicrobiales bacterium]|nr:GNAT family N-acetyltransferase [Acidimicrobiales bacterium]
MTRPDFELARLDLSSREQLNDIATVATRAFQFDPFFVYLSAHPLIRARGLALFWRSQMAALRDRGEGYGARGPDGRLLGVAVWLPPGTYPLPVRLQLRQAMGALRALVLRPKALVDGSRYLLAIEKAHPDEAVWYLNLLVTEPAVQRSGIGSALQQAVLERADLEAVPCYLETQNFDNLAYYRRFGYEVVEELRPVAGGPPLWTMRREPRPGPSA